MARQQKTEEGYQRALANLRPLDWSQADPEEVRQIKVKGAAAVNEAKKRARDIKGIYAYLLEMDAHGENLGNLEKAAQELAAERGQALSVYEAIALAQAAKAMKGDTGAAVFVRDSAGDKPTDKAAITGMMTEGDAALMAQLQAKFAREGNKSTDSDPDNSLNIEK